MSSSIRANGIDTSGASSQVAIGVACGLATAFIWSIWAIATRHAVTGVLGPGDVTFLRFAVSAVVLTPLLWIGRATLRNTPFRYLLIMVVGAGAPFMLTTSTGMKYAPASHVATLMIGLMPIFVALLSSLVLKSHLTTKQIVGVTVVFTGVMFIGGHSLLFNREAGEWRGDALFVAAGFLFATYTVAQRLSGLSPWLATAWVNVISAALFSPVYFIWMSPKLQQASASEVLVQIGAQGIAVSILALWLYTEAIKRLGATRAAIIGALCPALTAALAFPILGEIPSIITLTGVALVMVGVMVVVFNQALKHPPK